MSLLCYLKRLFAPFARGRQPTLPNSSACSTPKSTAAPKPSAKTPSAGPSTRPKSPKRYAETRAKTPNVSAKPIVPRAIVLHHSGGSYAGGVSWIKNPASRVSYHVLVAPDGRRTVFAEPTQRTWHAGRSEWRGKRDLNSWSVGASFSGDTNREPLTHDAMASMADYLMPLLDKYNLAQGDITDHRTVSPGRKDDLKPSELARFKGYLADRLSHT